MGAIYRQELAYSTAIKDQNAKTSSWYDVGDCDRVCFLISVVKTESPGNLTLTLQGSCDDGATAITLGFQDGAGVGESEVYSTTAGDHLWLDMGVAVPRVRVSLISAATTDATNYWTPKVWLIGYKEG